jgi:nicotinamidase-related amidase
MTPNNNNKMALLVIDVQQGLFHKSHPIYKAEELLGNIITLVERAHQAGAPVFYIQHCDQKDLAPGTEGWKLHLRLQPQPEDILLSKQKSNSFEGTNLDEILKSKGMESLVITGLVTHGCVKNGCLGAKQLGYRVTLARDAHSSYNAKAAELIEEWNRKLSLEGVELKPTSGITFE